MDTKSLIPILLTVLVAYFGYELFFRPAAAPTAPPTPGILSLPQVVDPFRPDGDWAAPEVKTLGQLTPAAKPGAYKVGLKISNENAGLDSVELSDFSADVGSAKRMTLAEKSAIAVRAFATIRVAIHYTDPVLIKPEDQNVVFGITRADLHFKDTKPKPGDERQLTTWQFVDSTDPNEVRLRLFIGPKENPQVEIDKVFHIVDKDGYQVDVSHEVLNRSGFPITVTIDQAGPVNMPGDSIQSDMRLMQSAEFVGGSTGIVGDYKTIPQLQFTEKKLAAEDLGSFSAATNPILWTAESNRFFTLITRPMPTARDMGKMLPLSFSRGFGKDIPQMAALGNAYAEIVIPTWEPDWASHSEKWVMGQSIHGNAVEIPPDGKLLPVTTLRVYMGPQDRGLLKGDLAAPVSSPAYSYNLYSYLSVINFKRAGCSFFVSQTLAVFILGLLDIVHKVTFNNYGIAIILLVIVVRAMLHPLTRYSQVSIAKMQSKMKVVQPEIDRLKKKYAKEKSKLSEETMRVYRENQINPAGQVLGCLPMLLQMPIWTALYAGLAVDIDLRQASFIPGWITDLSNPDTLIRFHHPVSIPLVSSLMRGPINGINLLPILLAVVFFIQQRMQQKTMPKPSDEAQAKTQAISQYMILLFPFFLYLAPSGLNLYIFASTTGGIVDTWLVRRHLRATGILPPAGTKAVA